MTDGQTRVLILLLILAALELTLQPAVKKTIMGTWNTFNGALSQAAKPTKGPGGTQVA